MNTLDTDTLVVIEPPVQSNTDSTTTINTTEETSDVSTSEMVTTQSESVSDEPQQPVITTEEKNVEPPAAVEPQRDSSKIEEKDLKPETLEVSSKNEHESIAELSNQHSTKKTELDNQPIQQDIEPEPVLTPDIIDNQIAISDTGTSTIQTINDQSITEHSMLPFAIEWLAISAVLITAILLLISSRKIVKKVEHISKAKTVHQHISNIDIEFEKAKIVAESRQQWIQTLREEIANFVSATNAIWDLHKIKDGCEDILTEMKDPQFVMKELYHWACKYNQAMQETEKLYAKIHLLINPQEETSQQLSSLLDKAMVAVEAKKSPSKLNDEIIEISQRILKDEWVRVKGFS